MVDLQKTLLPKIYQFVVVRLLESNRTFSPRFIESIKSLYLEGQKFGNAAHPQINGVNNQNGQMDCKIGCSHCCGLTVKVATPELYIIFEHLLETKSQTEIELITQGLRHYIELKTQRSIRDERVAIKCSFLKNDICSIYEVRPMVCRAWNSQDVNKCIEFLTNPDIEIPTNMNNYAPFDTIRKGICKALYVVGLDDNTEELNAGILRLLEGEFGK